MTVLREPRRAALFGAVVLLFGCVAAFAASERAIAERRAAADVAAVALHADEAALRADATVETYRARLAATVHAQSARAGVAAYLHDAARAAEANHARILIVDAAANGSRPGETSLRITVDGRYADVLPAIRALSRLRVPATLTLSSIARTNPGTGAPTVTATIDVLLAIPERPADVMHARPT